MTSDVACYHCGSSAKKGQSSYSNHGVQVCLDCYKVSRKCNKCKFPSKKLVRFEGYGEICEFCQKELKETTFGDCYLCKKTIYKGASVYEDHGVNVCQNCFKNALSRCFFCRFPKTTVSVKGLGRYCEFCEPTLIHAETDVQALLKPLEPFLKSFGHGFPKNLPFKWIAKDKIIKIQPKQNSSEVLFFEDFTKSYSPLVYYHGEFLILQRIQLIWLLPLFGGQAVALELCEKNKLKHLSGNSPFYELARGWCHWISFITAKTLKYETVYKSLQRNVSSEVSGIFPRFLAMSEYRKPSELITYTNETLEEYAKKYL